MQPSSDEVKDVYAHFGRAYYYSDVLHRGLCHLYAFSLLPPSGITRPRVEELLSEAYGSTLGRLVNGVASVFPPEHMPSLRAALERRNFIAHHFWFERIHLLTSAEGCATAIAELSDDSESFQALDEVVESLVQPLLIRLGATESLLNAALADVLAGNEDEPLLDQRRPKKEEVVTAVYDVPVAGGGGSTLIFRTEDSELWQLCDAGLGWSRYQEVRPEWVESEPFRGLLPAHIAPRPPCRAPWSYEIFFGKGVSLVVSPGPNGGTFRWTLRRANA